VYFNFYPAHIYILKLKLDEKPVTRSKVRNIKYKNSYLY
jgi:hypothetical protein